MGPGNKPNILQLIAGAEPLGAMRRAYDSAGRTVLLRDMVGGALSVYAAALIARTGGTHVFVAEDRDAAAYLLNDFYALLDEKQVYFFPGSYKRSIVYGTEDAQGVVQRTAALSALRREMAAGEYRIICTYPEALAERVTDPDSMRRETVRVKVGDRLTVRLTLQTDRNMDFVQVRDERPACMEPLQQLSGYRWGKGIGYYQVNRDAASCFFIDYLPKGTYTIEYEVSVDRAGTYRMGTASVQSAYAPEFESHTEGGTMTVR
jgi:hypothetical protein